MRRRPAAPASRLAVLVLVGALLVVIAVAIARAGPPDRVVGYGQIRYRGAGPERWAARYRRARIEVHELRAEVRRLRRVVLADGHVVEAINLACATFGYCSTLWRKARCETGGTFAARAHNASSNAAGLFQFLPSTWRSTPYGVFSVWSPYANALGAGWMHAHGRGNEWACR